LFVFIRIFPLKLWIFLTQRIFYVKINNTESAGHEKFSWKMSVSESHSLLYSLSASTTLSWIWNIKDKKFDIEVTTVRYTFNSSTCVKVLYLPHIIWNQFNASSKSRKTQGSCLFWFYTPCPKKILPFFFLGAQCVESGVSCTDCY